MQRTILISGTYPILDEKLNDLLGRSYDIAALEQPFPVNARKFCWVEAVVVYVPYCGEPEDAAAAQRYTEARAAADWATKEGLRCDLLIDAEAHSFLPCVPSACTVFILPELYGLDRRGRPVGISYLRFHFQRSVQVLYGDPVEVISKDGPAKQPAFLGGQLHGVFRRVNAPHKGMAPQRDAQPLALTDGIVSNAFIGPQHSAVLRHKLPGGQFFSRPAPQDAL